MFSYKNFLTLNSKFNKSTNIIYDVENCSDYIITKSTKDTLRTLFRVNYHNSISLIGPFGCGKSSLLLYINTLLSQDKEAQTCYDTLKQSDPDIFLQYKNFIQDKTFLKIKVIGEHTSFKLQLKNSLLQYSEFKNVYAYLNQNIEFQLSKLLTYLEKDIVHSQYSDVLLTIDEFGKFIEYGIDALNPNDIFDLQTLAEFVNKKENYKLIISLHKSFSEYTNYKEITYTDWEKIQGRFEAIVFKDDYYEMLNIFKETIIVKSSPEIQQSIQLIHNICKNSILVNSIFNNQYDDIFSRIAPIHPFSAIVISEIFTKYFQNQRSIFSFIFSSEPYAFQEFIEQERYIPALYALNNLYDYVTYLLKVYSILLPDKELWFLSEYQVQNEMLKSKNQVKIDIIKTIGLLQSFKLSNIIRTNLEYLILALNDKYEVALIEHNIQELIQQNILVFQEQTQAFSLLEDSNIDINRELNIRISDNRYIDYETLLNEYNVDQFIIAKRYFTEYGNKKTFEKLYAITDNALLMEPYKIFFALKTPNELLSISKQNNQSIFFTLNHIEKIKELIRKIYALCEIQEEFNAITSVDTKAIIATMINDYSIGLMRILEDNHANNFMIYNGRQYDYSSQQLQKILSSIVEYFYHDSPKINNYTFTHMAVNKGSNTTSIKNLFKAMLDNSHLKDFGIAKFPPEKALYLSVIKPSGVHKQNQKTDLWELTAPNNNLNFLNVWQFISSFITSKIPLNTLISKLEEEPFGLNEANALFMISLFVVVNNEQVNIIRENTYTYTLTLDLLMNMWKAPQKYELQIINLSQQQEAIFKLYVQITTDLTDYKYSKEKVLSIIKVLYTKFSSLPEFAKNTKKLSQEAISLRSVLISMKDPIEAFFLMFPQALGYASIDTIKDIEFIQKFKNAFNEIALIYKKEVSELEQYIADVFYFEARSFPYANKLADISNKLSQIEHLDTETKAVLRSFIYSNSALELINNLSVILTSKKLHECYDSDIESFKNKLESIANQMLSKLELVDIADTKNEVRKISLKSLEKELNKVIKVDRKKLDIIDKQASRIKEMIPDDYSHDEKLYLISQLLNKEFLND
jgi:hypothetical protein